MKFRAWAVPLALCLIGAAAGDPALSASAAGKPTTTVRKARSKTVKPKATQPKATQPKVTAPGSAPTTVAASRTTAIPPTLSGSVSVFAATSLTASFTDIAAAFEKVHPGVKVTLNFAGSSTLVTQINNGAPADVFASADMANMDKLVAAQAIDSTPVVFTKNTLMMVVPKGNPLRIKTLADLSRSEVFVGLGSPGVPAGDYARQILLKAGVTVTPKTLESNVAAIVNKAALREIDAGIVYVTDVAIDDYRVDGVAIRADQNIVATYPIATTSAAKNKSAAAGFVEFVQTPTAQAVLAKYKFLPLK